MLALSARVEVRGEAVETWYGLSSPGDGKLWSCREEWELEELEDPNGGSNVLRDPAQEKAARKLQDGSREV